MRSKTKKQRPNNLDEQQHYIHFHHSIPMDSHPNLFHRDKHSNLPPFPVPLFLVPKSI